MYGWTSKSKDESRKAKVDSKPDAVRETAGSPHIFIDP